MTKYSYLKATLLAGIGLVFALASASAQTILTNSYTNTFDTGGNTSPFTGGSVASWIYWYGVYQDAPLSYANNLPMTNDPTMDAQNDTNTSGSLLVVSPFGTSGDQDVFFGTFGNGGAYDKSVQMPLNIITNISFDIHVAPGTTPDSSGDFGTITMALIDPTTANGGNFSLFSPITIPGTASNGWVHLSDTNIAANITAMINAGFSNVMGVGFDYNSYSGYPKSPVTFWIDNVAVTTASAPPPPPPAPTLSAPQVALPGLNFLAVDNGQQYNRYDIATVNDTGYSFVGQSSVTYSWTITAFPGQAYSGFQQQLFLISSPTGNIATEAAADYNEANVVFITVQYESGTTSTTVTNGSTVTTNTATNWFGVLNFRYKTNEPNGNGMIFNGTSPTNTASNPNGWPIQPIGSVQAPTPLGTWSVTFNNTTNIMLTSPSGATSNFTWDAASAQLFADPMYVILGDQPNITNGYGQDVVITNFSLTGAESPFSDNFVADGSLNTGLWELSSSDANGIQFVPAGTNYWISWTIPDSGYDLQVSPTLNTTNDWTYVTGANASAPLTEFLNAGARTILFSSPQSSVTLTNQAYFRLRNDGQYGP